MYKTEDPTKGSHLGGISLVRKAVWGRSSLTFHQQVLDDWSQGESGKVTQQSDNQRGADDQYAEGKRISGQRTQSSWPATLSSERSGQGKRWNGESKPPDHHSHGRRYIVEDAVRTEAREVLPIVCERRCIRKQN